ncbi:low affinity high capacity ammonium permease [Podospora pseudocomata]|uniref:Low affinity high capacity ammonium permease n=1 Tax=Podospora pseudocomata TaxID=2093779 RepID=A0ABR0GSB2_9PEZI|nr:low affinity high capacity ammonium permease [Podospora pseudocomata]
MSDSTSEAAPASTPLHSARDNLNEPFNAGDQAYILVSSGMVLLMIPASPSSTRPRSQKVGLVANMGRHDVFQCHCLPMVFGVIHWALSPTATNGFIGNLDRFGLRNALGDESPAPLHSRAAVLVLPGKYLADFDLRTWLDANSWKMQFAAVTAALVIGATAERGRVIPGMVFTFFWATLVYCPLAYWAWGAEGWAFKWGVFDYAGGGPVEIGSGVSALAYSWVLGRRNEKMMLNFRPHNISLITLGTILLWFGWLGFNGGSAFGANLRAAMACWNTCLTAMFAAMTCAFSISALPRSGLVGWCSGTISGLVAATPASGVITPGPVFCLVSLRALPRNFGTKIKFYLRIDDARCVRRTRHRWYRRSYFQRFFAADYIIGLMASTWAFRLYKQIVYILAGCGYTFVVSAHRQGHRPRSRPSPPCFPPRLSFGMDDDQHGEFAYDYVEVRRDYLCLTPAEKEQRADGDVVVLSTASPGIKRWPLFQRPSHTSLRARYCCREGGEGVRVCD